MKHIKTVHIKNFQSHADTTIDLDRGLNILVGGSDQGKTAVIRALRWVMFNEPRGTGFIRVGETRCEVTLTLSDETRISRIRDEAQRINRYVIQAPDRDEQIFEKFNKDVPLEIQRELGVNPLWIDRDRGFELNIARQLDSPFLLDETGSTRAKVIGRIANLHILDAAQRDVLKDIKNLGKTKANLEEETASLQAKIKEYDDLPEKENQLKELKRILDQVALLENKLSRLDSIRLRAEKARTALEDSEKIINQLNRVEYVNRVLQNCLETSAKLKMTVNLSERINSVNTRLITCTNKINELENIPLCAEIHSQIESLALLLASIKRIDKAIDTNGSKLEALRAVVEGTANIRQGNDKIQNLYELRHEGIRLQELRRRVKLIYETINRRNIQLNNLQTELARLGQIRNLEETNQKFKQLWEQFNNLIDLDRRYQSAQNKSEVSGRRLETMEQRLQKLANDYVDVLTRAGRCPTCHSPITTQVIREISDSIRLTGS